MLSLGERTACARGHELALTGREFDILAQLAQRPGWVFTPEQLCSADPECYASPDAVNVHVSRLRRKLADAGIRDLLQTVRGVGWRLCRPDGRHRSADPEAAAASRCIATARTASAHWEFGSAVELLDTALSHLEECGLEPKRRERVRAAVLERRGASMNAQHHPEQARLDYERALESLPTSEHRARARVYTRLAYTCHLLRDRGGAETALVRAIAALDRVPERDASWWRSWIEVRLQEVQITCITDLPLWDPALQPQLAAVIDRYATISQKSRFHLALADMLAYEARWAQTDLNPAVSEARQSVEHALCDGTVFLQGLTIGCLGCLLVFAGQYAEAEVRLRQAVDLTRRCHDTLGVQAATMFLSLAARLSGDARTAEHHARELLALLRQQPTLPEFECAALGQLSWVALRRDDLDSAARLSDQAIDVWMRDPSMSQSVWVMAWPAVACAMAGGAPDRAFEYATLMTRSDQQALADGMETRIAQAVADFRSGRTARATRALAELHDEARRRFYA